MAGGKLSTGYIIGAEAPYYELISNNEEADDIRQILRTWDETRDPYKVQELRDRFRNKYGYDYDDVTNKSGDTQESIKITDRNGENLIGRYDGAVYRLKYVYTPYVNGQYQGPLFRKGQFDERADNPQGLTGGYLKYLNGMAMRGRGSDTYLERKDKVDLARNLSDVYKKPQTEEEIWPTPQRLTAHSWSPMLAVSYDLSDNGRLFARFARATRFQIGRAHV